MLTRICQEHLSNNSSGYDFQLYGVSKMTLFHLASKPTPPKSLQCCPCHLHRRAPKLSYPVRGCWATNVGCSSQRGPKTPQRQSSWKGRSNKRTEVSEAKIDSGIGSHPKAFHSCWEGFSATLSWDDIRGLGTWRVAAFPVHMCVCVCCVEPWPAIMSFSPVGSVRGSLRVWAWRPYVFAAASCNL